MYKNKKQLMLYAPLFVTNTVSKTYTDRVLPYVRILRDRH